MDDDLRKRLDAIAALLAVIALLLAVLIVAVGGAKSLALSVLVGLVLALLGWIARAVRVGPSEDSAESAGSSDR